ncbi:MAG TPA: hypothetical protein VE913_22200 [Longimicrobium sp.]|nr:hypothetical protein [Longimicrobium sp.]
MPILADGYSMNATGTAWQLRNSGGQGNNAVQAHHAERQVYTHLLANRTPPFLIVQNAFPCAICHGFFTGASAARSIVVKVTANEGQYSQDHGLGPRPALPCILYYHAEASRLVGTWSRGAEATPPGGFPAFPDIEAY